MLKFAAKERDIMSATEKLRSQLNESYEKQKELASEISTLKVRLSLYVIVHNNSVKLIRSLKFYVYAYSNNYPKLKNACKLPLDWANNSRGKTSRSSVSTKKVTILLKITQYCLHFVFFSSFMAWLVFLDYISCIMRKREFDEFSLVHHLEDRSHVPYILSLSLNTLQLNDKLNHAIHRFN